MSLVSPYLGLLKINATKRAPAGAERPRRYMSSVWGQGPGAMQLYHLDQFWLGTVRNVTAITGTGFYIGSSLLPGITWLFRKQAGNNGFGSIVLVISDS